MADIYSRLQGSGIDRKFTLAAALPPGWYDSKARRPEGRLEAEQFLAGALGVSSERLTDPEAALTLDGGEHPATLNPSDAEWEKLRPTLSVARRAAEIAASCVTRPRPDWLSGMEPEPLRSYIISERRVVRLRSLIDTVYGLGVPIIRMARAPSGAKAIDSAVFKVGDTPVVVLGSRMAAPAWLLAHIAHALGHVALGHTSRGPCVDVNLLGPLDEPAEAEADSFAQQLLHGSDQLYLEGHDRITGVKLASLARRFSKDHALEVGAVVVRFAFAKAASGRQARAPALRALKELGVSEGGHEMVLDSVQRSLDLRKLSPPERRFLCHVTDLRA